jgi:Helicase conserved C-terminal domain
MKRAFVAELLTLLEQTESRLLSWGFYDGGFLPSDIESLIASDGPNELRTQWETICASGGSLPRLLDDMRQAGLLYQPLDNPAVLRTRFAETVRLLARLRQMFRVQDWATGPRLVRDIKLQIRARRYPKRDLTADVVWEALSASARPSDLQRLAFDRLSTMSSGMRATYAGFQARAFERIFVGYKQKTGYKGTVISAGTGSGKTKAFYVPAMLGIVDDIARTPAPFTKVLAIYPRNVLLADQLREAIAETLKLTGVLGARGLRPITVGALLGDTPPANTFQQSNSVFLKNWKRVPLGWIVPFVRSPTDEKSELIWRDLDRGAGRTSLYRVGASRDEAPSIPDGVLALTREALQARAPDILFVSLEMLNQELGNPQWFHTFGVGEGILRPRLLLLDEVHSYSGLSGAQLPWILRRWMLAGDLARLHVVGLSATLKDAASHLENVTGISATSIQEISPLDDPDSKVSELLSEGAEYNLAVRGNTMAGAPLLATSIQAAMLLGRSLTADNRGDAKPGDTIEGAFYYARKIFGFTDNLDVLNRWLSDLTNADNQLGLAGLRASSANNPPAAFREGQVWDLPEQLGHDLAQSLLIDRCSSQEPGVDPRARLVLATSSLEVGYDDPEVGVVLQHKAPSSMASFVQRKGRAGRRRGTRPMTVVLLSDFGRDRWAYKDSHRLFSDAIERIRLPALNPYVLKIQASWLLIDIVGRSIGRPQPFRYLAQEVDEEARRRAKALLEEMLSCGPAWERFRSELQSLIEPYVQSVRPGSDVVRIIDGVLWDAPRPILRQVIPALLKQLEGPPAVVAGRRPRPIPEYIPERTFSEIDTREIRIDFAGRPDKTASFEASRFLFEFCPGRVSKRFSVRRGELGYWPSVSATLSGAAPCSFDVANLASECTFVRELDGVPVYAAHSVQLSERPRNIRDSSQGSWDRKLHVESLGTGVSIAVFQYGLLNRIFSEKRAYLHRDSDGLRLLRYAKSGNYEILGDRDLVIRGRFELATQPQDGSASTPQGIGFERVSDGILLEIDRGHLTAFPALPQELTDRFRTDYFLHVLLASKTLRDLANTFAIGYLWQTSLAMLTATSLAQGCSLQEAQTRLKGQRARAADVIIGRLLGGADDDDRNHGSGPTKRHQQILALWDDPVVLGLIEQAERVLWAPFDDTARPWLTNRYVYTLAAAFQITLLSLLPDVPEDDVAVDVYEADGKRTIAISESTSGGLGHIEALLAIIASDPSKVETALRAALVQCTRGRDTDTVLELVAQVRRGATRQSLSTVFRQIRAARSFSQIEASKNALRSELRECGLDASRDAVLAIMANVLRPGSSPNSDRWLAGLNALWRRKSEEAGITISPAVFAYWCTRTHAIDRRFRQSLTQATKQRLSDQQVFLAVEGLLHEDCRDSCHECMGTGDPTKLETKPSRSLALHWIGIEQDEFPLRYGTSNWLRIARDTLRRIGRVTLSASAIDVKACVAEMGNILVFPIESDYLMVAASLAEVRRQGRDWIFVWQARGLAERE